LASQARTAVLTGNASVLNIPTFTAGSVSIGEQNGVKIESITITETVDARATAVETVDEIQVLAMMRSS
jgi:4-hydroxy-3-methylbut-2-en-1-yl diphosphate synthase IspG/GcpE